MSDNYWNSPDAAYSMGQIGKQAGSKEGRQQGFAEGRNQGFQEGAAAMQERLEATIAQLRAENNQLREFSNGALTVLDAACEVLASSGSERQMADFILSYSQRVERSIQQRHYPLPPHADERFSAKMPRVAQIINQTLAKYLRR